MGQKQDAMIAQREPPSGKVSYEEFLAWADEDTLAEWVDGEVVMVSPALKQHQDVAGFLTSVLRMYVETRQLGMVLSAPFQMKLKNGREPDVLFIAKEHTDRLQETFLGGPADLVIEIVSPESGARDRGEKFYEYEAGGVPDYWLIDPQRAWADVYRLEGEHFRPAFSGNEGVCRSEAVAGFWLRIEWLWQEQLPAVLDVLGELGVLPGQ